MMNNSYGIHVYPPCCENCGGYGHDFTCCSSYASPPPYNMYDVQCDSCGNFGHTCDMWPSPQMNMYNVQCGSCGIFGHSFDSCPSYFSQTPMNSYMCNDNNNMQPFNFCSPYPQQQESFYHENTSLNGCLYDDVNVVQPFDSCLTNFCDYPHQQDSTYYEPPNTSKNLRSNVGKSTISLIFSQGEDEHFEAYVTRFKQYLGTLSRNHFSEESLCFTITKGMNDYTRTLFDLLCERNLTSKSVDEKFDLFELFPLGGHEAYHLLLLGDEERNLRNDGESVEDVGEDPVGVTEGVVEIEECEDILEERLEIEVERPFEQVEVEPSTPFEDIHIESP